MTPLPPDAPAWLQALHDECRRSKQVCVARRLGISPTTISLVLKGTYGANTGRVEARVREVLLSGFRTCPVLGEIETSQCLEEQSRPYFPDPIRSALYKACQTCPHRAKETE